MPDHRRHRGAHPQDAELFAAAALPALQGASSDLSWLLERGYAVPSSLKLVGDRHGLRERQRKAVMRATCGPTRARERQSRCLAPAALSGRELWIDGFNLITTVEAALAGGVLLACEDGTLRDVASMHGSYRRVAETVPALECIGETLAALAPASVRWLFDAPVSNSGRLAARVRELAVERGWPWQAELVPDPDPLLAATPAVVASADSVILDRCAVWLDLARLVVTEHVPDAWVVDLRA